MHASGPAARRGLRTNHRSPRLPRQHQLQPRHIVLVPASMVLLSKGVVYRRVQDAEVQRAFNSKNAAAEEAIELRKKVAGLEVN